MSEGTQELTNVRFRVRTGRVFGQKGEKNLAEAGATDPPAAQRPAAPCLPARVPALQILGRCGPPGLAPVPPRDARHHANLTLHKPHAAPNVRRQVNVGRRLDVVVQ